MHPPPTCMELLGWNKILYSPGFSAQNNWQKSIRNWGKKVGIDFDTDQWWFPLQLENWSTTSTNLFKFEIIVTLQTIIWFDCPY